MDKESRSDKMYREVAEFLENKSAEIRHLVLYKSEVERLEKYLYERDLSIHIIEKKKLLNGKVRITLQK